MISATANKQPIGRHVLPIDTWSPGSAAPAFQFEYIDIASVDRKTKQISATTTTSTIEAPSRARQIVRTNDVLVSTVRPNLNAVALVSRERDGAIASTGFCVLRCHPKKLDPAYLFHWVRTPYFIADMIRQATGASYPAVTDRIVKQSTIPLPYADDPARSLREQKRIAAILDKADAIRRKRQEAIGTTESLLGSAFQGIFGDPVSNSAGYKAVSLGDAHIRISDGNYSSKYPKASDFIKTGVPFIRANNLKQRTVIDEDMRFISEAQHAELRKGHLRANDVLIVTRGNIGEVALVPPKYEDANINAQLVLLRPTSKEFTPEFLLGFFCAPSVRGQVLKLQTGTALKQLPVGQLVQLTLPIVSEEKQNQFATVFQKQRDTLASLTSHRGESDNLFKSLVQRAFKGEL